MAMNHYDRRDLFKRMLTTGVGVATLLEQLGGVPLLGTWASQIIANPFGNPYDAYDRIRDALRFGPSALGVAQAMAQDDKIWVVVDIRIVNHVYSPLVFRLGPNASVQAGAASALVGMGVDQMASDPRFAALKFNEWFTKILTKGTMDGLAPTPANLCGLEAEDICDLSTPDIGGKVAFQTFLQVAGIDPTVNHALRGLKLRKDLPDMSLFLAKKDVLYSPLGISCFMMGGEYDKAEGTLAKNAVLDGNGEAPVIDSRTVKAYVDQIKQSIGDSYADRASIEQNVVYRMDKLVMADPVLRRELVNSLSAFKSQLPALDSAAYLEANRRSVDAAQGAGQSGNDGPGPTGAFLGQCKYVARSVTLPGTPLRNFSLFLNTVDLDGGPLDSAKNVGAPETVQAFSYVEGMRQLAMGLNVIAKAIAKEGKNIICFVHAEGGRNQAMGDDKTSFAMVMGPKGAGLLDDALHANMGLIGGTIPNPAAEAQVQAYDTPGSDILSTTGTKLTDVKPSVGDVAMGVVEFLEDKLGKKGREGLADDLGRYIKLKRGA